MRVMFDFVYYRACGARLSTFRHLPLRLWANHPKERRKILRDLLFCFIKKRAVAVLVGDERETKSPRGLNSQRHIQSLNKRQRQPRSRSLMCTKQWGGDETWELLTYTQNIEGNTPQVHALTYKSTECAINRPTSHTKCLNKCPRKPSWG